MAKLTFYIYCFAYGMALAIFMFNRNYAENENHKKEFHKLSIISENSTIFVP